jgi:hypothetical protein
VIMVYIYICTLYFLDLSKVLQKAIQKSCTWMHAVCWNPNHFSNTRMIILSNSNVNNN